MRGVDEVGRSVGCDGMVTGQVSDGDWDGVSR